MPPSGSKLYTVNVFILLEALSLERQSSTNMSSEVQGLGDTSEI